MNSLAKVLSDKQLVVWSTGNHTASPLFLFGFGPGAENFRGLHENPDVAKIMGEMIGK
ncbi:MAG: hypothetical protein AB1393_05595 [Candidatus Edwardsbacteria bacterium]